VPFSLCPSHCALLSSHHRISHTRTLAHALPISIPISLHRPLRAPSTGPTEQPSRGPTEAALRRPHRAALRRPHRGSPPQALPRSPPQAPTSSPPQAPLCSPFYSAISAQIPVESNLRWLQANIADVPKYLSQTRQRLQGTAAGADANTMDCSNCNSSGFVECGDCAGVGYSMKGQYAITCAVCCGAKKIRCGVCGGKCSYC
jgi:hypothetical protein